MKFSKAWVVFFVLASSALCTSTVYAQIKCEKCVNVPATIGSSGTGVPPYKKKIEQVRQNPESRLNVIVDGRGKTKEQIAEFKSQTKQDLLSRGLRDNQIIFSEIGAKNLPSQIQSRTEAKTLNR